MLLKYNVIPALAMVQDESSSIDDIEQFQDAMTLNGAYTLDTIIADGEFHRCHVEGDKPGTKNVSYFLNLVGRPKGYYKNFKTCATGHWSRTGSNTSEPMSDEMLLQIEAEKQNRAKELQRKQSNAAKTAQAIWEAATPISDQSQHPYLIKRGVQPHGLRLHDSALILPVYDEHGQITSRQSITVEEGKSFLKDGRKKGCFYQIGAVKPEQPILVGEGFATCASVYEETGNCTFVAWDAGNLKAVAQVVRKLYPDNKIIITGDNDESGVGQKAAKEAAIAVGGKYSIPDEVGKDWNDVLTEKKHKNSDRQHRQEGSVFFDGEKKKISVTSINEENFFSSEKFLNDVANITNVATDAVLDLSKAVDAKTESIDSAKATIDNALEQCKVNPGMLGSDDFLGALKVIGGASKSLSTEYRVKIKNAKPSGVLMKDIDSAMASDGSSEDGSDSIAAQLIDLVISRGTLSFDNKSDKGFISTEIGGVVHTLAIGSKVFIEWLSYEYYSKTKEARDGLGCSAPEAAIAARQESSSPQKR